MLEKKQLDKKQLSENLLPHLPILAMVLFAALTHFLIAKGDTASQYLAITFQTLLECSPFFITHQLTISSNSKLKALVWFLGFICYPAIAFNLETSLLLSIEDTVICALASIMWFINQRQKLRAKKTRLKQLTLDKTISLLLIIGALLMAAILTSNQSINEQTPSLVINSQEVFNQLPQFLWYLWQCLVITLLINGVYLINRYYLIQRILAKHGVLAFVSCAIIFLILATPALFTLVLQLPANHNGSLFLSEQLSPFALTNFQFVFLLLAISTPLILVFEKQAQQTTLAKAQQQQTITELQLLQQQINPHFLFNTLNNLYAMALTQSKQTPETIVKLSNLLRYTIYEGKKPQVTLAKEIAYLQDYIALEQIRNQHKCTIKAEFPKNAEQFKIAPLLFIMLIENAFKHGIVPSTEQGFITINMSMKGNQLTLLCENSVIEQQTPKAEKTTEKSKGIGLENLRRRLELLYPNRHTLNSEPHNNHWQSHLTLELTPC